MMKFKGVGKKQILVGVGFSLVLGGIGAAGWYFVPELGFVRSALSLVGLSKPDTAQAKSTSSPNSQEENGDRTAFTMTTLDTFSSKSQLVLAVRAMLNQQTELALGNIGAGARLKASMGIVAMMAARIDVRALSTQEYDAAAVYVLSGGRPEILERIAAEVKLDPERQSLFEGAISFVRGDLKAAAGKLATIDAAKFDPVLSARIYMLQAHLEDKAPYQTRKKMLQTAINITLGAI